MDQIDARYSPNCLSAIAKAREILSGPYGKILVSISGGADSDIMLDMIEMLKPEIGATVQYVFYNTGMEYQATLDHLTALETRYNIDILRRHAVSTVQASVRKYGQPFLNKQISNYISRLQKHGFTWNDLPFDVLYSQYPNCKAALRWWCNQWPENSRANINYYRQLKEYMIAHPPTFKISDMCCTATKKRTAKQIEKEYKPELTCIGVRRAEGGPRSTAYHSCFTQNFGDIDNFRPLFWLTNTDKENYSNIRNIQHSECYHSYGLDRTGCAGCPFGKKFNYELSVLKKHEPKLYNMAMAIFKDSYDYTNNYYRWRNQHD